jgi:hypothetical protein
MTMLKNLKNFEILLLGKVSEHMFVKNITYLFYFYNKNLCDFSDF